MAQAFFKNMKEFIFSSLSAPTKIEELTTGLDKRIWLGISRQERVYEWKNSHFEVLTKCSGKSEGRTSSSLTKVLLITFSANHALHPQRFGMVSTAKLFDQ